MPPITVSAHSPLVRLGRHLLGNGYRFTTPTPETHRRVIARPFSAGLLLTDIFGWNRPFAPSDISPLCMTLLEEAQLIERSGDQLRSKVRFSTIGPLLFAHSAFPTEEHDAVFFGPDTYRFTRAIQMILAEDPSFAPADILDLGSGSGAGGIFCASALPSIRSLVLADISERACSFSAANAMINDVAAQSMRSDLFSEVHEPSDFIVSNPPYLIDRKHRLYRDGGGEWGCELALRIVRESIDRLSPGGRLLLYTGTPIVRGRDAFLSSIGAFLRERTTSYRYEEIDPDVFGEELENAPYVEADRIAAVLLVVRGENIQR